MREIKFRIWCKENEQFIQFNKMGFLEDGSLWYVQGVDENEEETDPPYFENQNDWVLMQYTGLKDKNGVEIFEGDWIRVETQAKDNGEFPIGYVARANDKPEMFIALPEQHKETGERQYHLENLYKHYSDEFEVIGNIYENSDLMEVTA